VQLAGDLLEFVLFLLDFVCLRFDVLLLLLQLLDVFENGVVELLAAAVFELLVGLVFVDIYYLFLDFGLLFDVLRRLLLLLKLISWDVD